MIWLVVLWFAAPFVLLGLGALAKKYWLDPARRRLQQRLARERVLTDAEVMEVLRPHGNVENIVPLRKREV